MYNEAAPQIRLCVSANLAPADVRSQQAVSKLCGTRTSLMYTASVLRTAHYYKPTQFIAYLHRRAKSKLQNTHNTAECSCCELLIL